MYAIVPWLTTCKWQIKAFIKKIFGQTIRILHPKVFMEMLFSRGAISNLGTLFYTTRRLKKFYRIGPRSHPGRNANRLSPFLPICRTSCTNSWEHSGHQGPVGLCTCINLGGCGFESRCCVSPLIFSAKGQGEREKEERGDGKWKIYLKH